MRTTPTPIQPRSEAQRAASRTNGAKSQGPTTAPGKATSSRNATTHGFQATTLVTSQEDAQALAALVAAYTSDLRPATTIETGLVEQIAFAHFRLTRVQQLETAYLNQALSQPEVRKENRKLPAEAHLETAFTSIMKSKVRGKAMQTLDRQESRYRRAFDRALANLRAIQKDRQKELPIEPKQLRQLTKDKAEVSTGYTQADPLRKSAESIADQSTKYPGQLTGLSRQAMPESNPT